MLKFRKKTLSRDYFIFAAIIAATIVAISVLWTLQTYHSLNKDRQIRYETESQKISDELEESFHYLESFMRLISNDITRLDNPTPEKIAPLLERSWPRAKDSEYNYFAWSVLDFSNAAGEDLATSIHGALDEKIQLPNDRAWIKLGPKEPGKLIFSHPDTGIITKQYILPVGYGIKDKNGNYLGAISIGLNIDSLARKLENPSRKDTSFVILDQNNKIVAQSNIVSGAEDNHKNLPEDFFKDKLLNNDLTKADGKLRHPIEVPNASYAYYHKMGSYPFTILVGDDDYYYSKNVNNILVPRIAQSIILGLFFLLLMYFFQRKIIRPVTELSKAALEISKGNTDVKMPETDIHEYQVLASQLGNIKQIIFRLTSAQKDLEEALKAKSVFLSNMSHEFRTPLNAVIGFSETIKKQIFGDIGNKKYTEYVDDINQQGHYLLKLIEDILDASKMESGSATLYEEPLDFKRLVKESIRTVQQRAEAKHIKIISDMPVDLPYIKGDKTRIKQVVLNLLSNAVKFTAEKGKIHIRAHANDEFIFEVQDTGIGIAKDDLKKIAQRFTQVDNIYTRKNRGSGLGMSISKDIIEMHGGQFIIESEPNIGTKIIIKLPKERVIFGT